MSAPVRKSMYPKIAESAASMFTFMETPTLHDIMKLHDFKGDGPPSAYTWEQHLEQKLRVMMGSRINHAEDDPLTAKAVERAIMPWIYQDPHLMKCWDFRHRNVTTVYLTAYVFNKLTQYRKEEEEAKPNPYEMLIRGYNPAMLSIPMSPTPEVYSNPSAITANEAAWDEAISSSNKGKAKLLIPKQEPEAIEVDQPEPQGKLVQVTWLNPWGVKIVGEDGAIIVPDEIPTLSALVALLKKDAGMTLPDKKFLKQFGIIGHIEGTGKTVLRSDKRFLTWRDETLAKAEGPVHLWVGMANPRLEGPLAMEACVYGAGGGPAAPYQLELHKPMDDAGSWTGSVKSGASRPGSVAGDTTPPSVIDLDIAFGHHKPVVQPTL